ncbi:MAG: PCMD domain-containing protein [Muribaculaceae bacterium]|nr:PCMD domain-containing protein [Muribaculaceae bacterium]
MKILNKIISASAVAIAVLSMQGCVSETPFESGKEGTLRLSAQLRGDVTTVITRAADYDKESLENNLVVYIQKENVGVVRKFKGLADVQAANVALQTGQYILEGWTGDSVSASFDKKFYYGYQKVDIKEGANTVALKCDIANVLTSINTEYVAGKVSDLKMEIGHTRGSLEFDAELIESDPKGEKKGYFMMPKGVNELSYIITGKNEAGTAFSKEGTFTVERAHDYQFVLKADQSQITQGGALIKIEIVKVPTIDEEVTIFPAPSFRAISNGEDLDLEKQFDATQTDFADVNLRVLTFKGMESLKVSLSNNFPGGGISDMEIVKDGEYVEAGVSRLPDGIATQMPPVDPVISSDNEEVEVTECWFNLSREFMENMPSSSEEYSITFDVSDGRGFTNKAVFRFANSEEAIERLAPVGSYSQEELMANNQLMDYSAIRAKSATLYGALYDESVADFGIKVREAGTNEWTSYPGALTRASKIKTFTVTISNLKPGTKYEYKSYADEFEEEEARTFTTEEVFVIPNASLEEWSDYSANSKILLPGAGGERSFWDSGNHGSATMDVTLTKNIETLIHSGKYSAQLRSQFVGLGGSLGKFAAGNLFVGEYLRTDGTDGVLQFGRQYNGSHPVALKLWANYRPGKVEKAGNIADCDAADKVAVGDMDKSQIYVALTTEPVEVRTKKKERKLFNPNESCVIAYGEVTWTEAFGPDGVLQEVNIPLTYKASAKTEKPQYLVIVCSASKFGDYFCGGEGSTMIVDDFELVY